MILESVIRAVLARKGIFTLETITRATSLDRRDVSHALGRLEREGHIVRTRESGGAAEDGAPGRPRLNVHFVRKASLRGRLEAMEKPMLENVGRDSMWRAIRQLRRFTTHELCTVTDCTYANVKFFLRLLTRDGYVRYYGRKNGTWALVKDPGPRRPATAKTSTKDQPRTTKEARIDDGTGGGQEPPEGADTDVRAGRPGEGRA